MSPVPEKGCMGKQHACLPWQMTKTLDSPKTSSRQLKQKTKQKRKQKHNNNKPSNQTNRRSTTNKIKKN